MSLIVEFIVKAAECICQNNKAIPGNRLVTTDVTVPSELLNRPRLSVVEKLFQVALALFLNRLLDLTRHLALIERTFGGVDDAHGTGELRQARHPRENKGEHRVAFVMDNEVVHGIFAVA